MGVVPGRSAVISLVLVLMVPTIGLPDGIVEVADGAEQSGMEANAGRGSGQASWSERWSPRRRAQQVLLAVAL